MVISSKPKSSSLVYTMLEDQKAEIERWVVVYSYGITKLWLNFLVHQDLSEKKKKTSTTVAPKFPRKLAAFWAAKWVNFIQHPLSYHQQRERERDWDVMNANVVPFQ
ncbi:hypothetical protein ACSBR2_020597 [Camellia fascicularis]